MLEVPPSVTIDVSIDMIGLLETVAEVLLLEVGLVEDLLVEEVVESTDVGVGVCEGGVELDVAAAVEEVVAAC